ncbi:MAG: hypothetical protein EBY95_08260, partial [Actinobacteria bacterium]|nr:hypothetical protein [Actinomycetota bacterium]
IVSVFEAVGEFTHGRISQEDFEGIERNAVPGSGSCGGMYTANTMSSSFEALGMSLLGSSTMANPDAEKVAKFSISLRLRGQTTTFTRRWGTTTTFLAVLPAIALATASSASANAVSSSLVAPRGTVRRVRTLPLTCTGISIVSVTRSAGSATGKAA